MSVVTSAHIEQYRRDGAVLIKGALSSADVAQLERGIEQCYREERGPATVVEGGATGGATVVRDYASMESPVLADLLGSGRIGAIGSALMQAPSAQLILDQVFYKAGGPVVATPWHQDTPFLRVRGESIVRLWFPCDFSPRHLTVQVLRGSHRWDMIFSTQVRSGDPSAKEGATGIGDPGMPMVPDVARFPESFDILTFDVAPGDVLAFQGNVVHGAGGHPNHPTPRRAYAVLLGGPDLRYHAPRGKAFPSPGRMRGLRAKDDIPDAAKIGAYPDAFPVC